MRMPVDVSRIYEGERIPEQEVFVTLEGVELLRVSEELREGVAVSGRELEEMKRGERLPFGLRVLVKGRVSEDAEGVLERRLHEFINYIQGVVHEGSRDNVRMIISTRAVEQGLKLEHIGMVLVELLKKEYPAISGVSVEVITDEGAVRELAEQAAEVYRRRDERAASLRDEDVDVFYACEICENHAPRHECIISPSRPSGCGVISWLEARAAAEMGDQALKPVSKGRAIDEAKGEFEGVNEHSKAKGKERVFLHSIFEHPHSQCSCAQAVVFYIPEVDGIGIVDAGFKGKTPFGLDFASIIKQIGDGSQHTGFTGVSIAYLRSPKFLQGDGGWSRVVWMPAHLKEMLRDVIPAERLERILTEREAATVEELQRLLGARREESAEGERQEQVVLVPGRWRFRVNFQNAEFRVGKVIIE
ncbi:MAG: CO dehydrogenase/CO-methylating acetyl-CoA synthase complex subunit beta [Euryarchaeota archaeon]|nr:CO dehydrogenase/CO-methylating acetyl-CoA synthase complex subunit beta [Euryarchaeota archaeon]